MKSIKIDRILVESDKIGFPNPEEVIIINNSAYEFMYTIHDLSGESYCLLERTKKAIEQQTIKAHKEFEEYNNALKEQIIKNINFVIEGYGFSCHKVEYTLPDSPTPPIQVYAFVGEDGYNTWDNLSRLEQKEIKDELLLGKYLVTFK